MAQRLITRSCGHSEWVGFYRAPDDWQIARESEKLCLACYREERAKAAAEAAAKAKDEWGLPELTGSEKQVAWAEDIRLRALSVFQEARELLQEAMAAAIKNNDNDDIEVGQKALDILNTLLREESAKWWIDNRDSLTYSRFVLRLVGERMKEEK